MVEAKSQPYVTLNNGVKMPQIGLGTTEFGTTEEEFHKFIVSAVVDHGYRSLDTAKLYGNEEAIGKALKECFEKGIKREDMFITTKIWHDQKDDVEGALRGSLTRLGLDYVDLYLVHWYLPKMDWTDKENPVKGLSNQQVWQELERLYEAGLIKALGVSNFSIPNLLDMLTYCKIRPTVNQVEIHPYLVQKEYVDFHKILNVKVESYGPLAAQYFFRKKEESLKLNLLQEPVILELSAKYNRTPGQIVLNWHLNRDLIIIPKTTKIERLDENMNCYDFKMEEGDYERISGLNCNARSFDPITWGNNEFNFMPYFA